MVMMHRCIKTFGSRSSRCSVALQLFGAEFIHVAGASYLSDSPIGARQCCIVAFGKFSEMKHRRITVVATTHRGMYKWLVERGKPAEFAVAATASVGAQESRVSRSRTPVFSNVPRCFAVVVGRFPREDRLGAQREKAQVVRPERGVTDRMLRTY